MVRDQGYILYIKLSPFTPGLNLRPASVGQEIDDQEHDQSGGERRSIQMGSRKAERTCFTYPLEGLRKTRCLAQRRSLTGKLRSQTRRPSLLRATPGRRSSRRLLEEQRQSSA